MTLAIQSISPSALELQIDGKLDSDDYRKFVPVAEERIKEHGAISLVIHVTNLRGWTPAAMWQDLKFDVKHYRDISRLALVAAESSKNDWMAAISKPFTAAEVAVYPETEVEAARQWATATAPVSHGSVS